MKEELEAKQSSNELQPKTFYPRNISLGKDNALGLKFLAQRNERMETQKKKSRSMGRPAHIQLESQKKGKREQGKPIFKDTVA